MTEVVSSASAPVTAQSDAHPALVALRLADERACEGYLVARKAMLAAAAYGLSLIHLAAQHPGRADYRAAAAAARVRFRDAEARVQLAYARWQRAANRYDAAWTATVGRAPRLSVA